MTENAAPGRATGGLDPSLAAAPSSAGAASSAGAPSSEAAAATSTGEAAAGPAADIATLAFDRALEELRDVVVRLEDGGLPLEESIALYERGAALHEHCGRLLEAAELRVQRLVDAAGGSSRTLDLRPGDEDDDA